MEKMRRVVLPLIALAVIWTVYFVVNWRIADNKIMDVDGATEAFEKYCFQIDSVNEDSDEISISGWCFKLGEDAPSESLEPEKMTSPVFILADTKDSENKHYIKASWIERPDVNEYFKCEYDYTNCGLHGEGKAGTLKLNENVYEIYIKCDRDNDKALKTGCFINRGELVYVNPDIYVKPEVEGTDLETIIEEGYIRFYRPENGIYVYQYDWKLYWIADETFDFAKGDDTYIQYQMNTTQIQNLPKDRLDNGWYWSNMGAPFKDYEITGKIDCGKYRVYERDIPTEYSVTEIWTGYTENEWIWLQFFRPCYEFRQYMKE